MCLYLAMQVVLNSSFLHDDPDMMFQNSDRKMAEQLCKSLGCGGVKEIPKLDEMMKEDFRESEKMAVDCADIDPVSNLWQCVRKNLKCRDPVVVTCEGNTKATRS